jgi:hypothetical protein
LQHFLQRTLGAGSGFKNDNGFDLRHRVSVLCP